MNRNKIKVLDSNNSNLDSELGQRKLNSVEMVSFIN